jgi:hypothetical protein
VADKVKTEEAASTQPCEGLHRSKGVIMLCGWAIHGIFCCCSGETVVTQLMPRTMKSDEIEQEEYDKFYKLTADNRYGTAAEKTKRYVERFFTTDDFKNKMPSNLSLVMGDVDSDNTPLSTSRELLQQHEFSYPLNDTANSTQQIEADTMIDEEKTAPDKEPLEDNDNQDRDILFKDVTKGEMAPLDALYPKLVSTYDEKQQTLHRISTMPESTYQEAVKNETYRENRSRAKEVEGEIARLDALYPTMRVLSDYEKQKTTHRMSANPPYTRAPTRRM